MGQLCAFRFLIPMDRLQVRIEAMNAEIMVFPFLRPEDMQIILFNLELILQVCICRYAYWK